MTPVFDADFFPSAEGLSPGPFGKYCPQSRLEPILLRETRRLGSEVCYGVDLVSFTRDDTGVAATIKDLDSGALSGRPVCRKHRLVQSQYRAPLFVQFRGSLRPQTRVA